MGEHGVSLVGRARQTRRLLRSEGVRGVSDRLRRRGAALLSPPGLEPIPISHADLRGAATALRGSRGLPEPLPWRDGEPLTVAWVTTPPSEGSGGHTTMLRMVQALEALGHDCPLYLVDRHGWDLDRHRATIRRCWPGVRSEIRSAVDGFEDAHAVMATSWETVYTVVASPAAGARLYFVQDYEPLFHPAGSHYLLAEATYRFGLHGVTAGRWLAQKLALEHGMPTDHFDFGCDVETYHLDRTPGAGARRAGISYYCRPSTPRRANELALAALGLFAEQRPDVEIHLYGERVARLPFPAVQHGLLSPAELNRLYNRSIAGLSLSATNVSLVPHEMLSSGCIPVVNEAEQNRIVLDNEHVRYARATPFDLATALVDLAEAHPRERAAAAEAAAASVAGSSWTDAGRQVERVITGAVARQQPARHG